MFYVNAAQQYKQFVGKRGYVKSITKNIKDSLPELHFQNDVVIFDKFDI